MTKEHAKEILRYNTDLGHGVIIENESTQAIYEALNMTIEALEQNEVLQKENEDFQEYIDKANHTNSQLIEIIERHKMLKPCEDCVSRQAVITIIQNHWWNCKDIDELVKALPPVTPTQRWIPVSERLPEEDGEYLLYGKIDEDEENYIFIGEYDSCGEQFGIWQEQFDRTTLGCLGSEFFDYSSVIAWQPLPKPYEEKRGSEDGSN